MKNKKNIRYLVLWLADNCNLKCKYCYAQGGNYGGNASLMHTKTADKVLRLKMKSRGYPFP